MYVGNLYEFQDMWDAKIRKKIAKNKTIIHNTINYMVQQFVYVHGVIVISLFQGNYTRCDSWLGLLAQSFVLWSKP